MSDHLQPRIRDSWTFRLVVAAIILATLVVFIAENFVVVEVRLIVWRTDIRLAWALLLASLLGFSLGLLVALIRRR